MPFAEDQHMIQALASKRPDQTLNIGVLPRRSRCDRAVANPHRSDAVREGLPISSIIVADQILMRQLDLFEALFDPLSIGGVGESQPTRWSA
jgi:hypothetical protein